MDWSNERWLRLYTRDTGDWLMWPWQTRALLLFILRKVDRSGMLHLGKGKLAALAAIVGMPSPEVTEWIEPLLEDGCIQIRDGVLLVPNFIAAQETQQTDRARQRATRERLRDKFVAETGREPSAIELVVEAESKAGTLGIRSQTVTPTVTPSHTPSQEVTTRQDETIETDERESDARAPAESVTRIRKSDRCPPPDLPEATPASTGETSTGSPGVASGESGFDLARRVWCEMWRTKYRRDYEFTDTRQGPNSEDFVLKRMGERALIRGAQAEVWLRHKFAAYLADKGDKSWLVEKCHPLRTLERDLTSYGDPKPPARMVPRRAEEPAEPVSAERQAEFAKQVAAVGRGGAV